ncbi:MAG: hypothetical protein JW712_03875 [Dehalococcoidales bacterium]|nr:hypothetical protein [Dehalococcoidales bacterium]
MSGIGEGRTEAAPQDKMELMFESWLSGQRLNFVSPETEKAYRDRVHMIKDVVQLKVPERIPIYANIGFFPAYYAGITTEEAMYDYDKLVDAWSRYILELQPDIHGGSATPGPGKSFEILDYNLYLWPGHGTTSDSPYQCVEKEYMLADEYDELIRDPSDFWTRKYVPRIFGKLKAFERMGSLGALLQMPFSSSYFLPFGRPEMREALEALMEAGEEAVRWRKAVSACNRKVTEAGFPLVSGGSTLAPYDAIADTLRGSRGVMSDIYRQPDKLLEAMDKLVPVLVELGAESARAIGRPLIFIPLHKGADAFMSDRHYKTFYWPTLKKMIEGFIDQGLVPFLFAEGEYTSRLEIIQDVPVGKTIWHFDYTDMALAKQNLSGIACIAGNVPVSILNTGTPGDIEEYCKNLIDTAGKGGGFMMTSGGVIDKARPENVKAMIDYTRNHGIY